MIALIDFGGRNVKLSMNASQERLDAAAFFFKRMAAGDVQFKGECSDMHFLSLASGPQRNKAHLGADRMPRLTPPRRQL